MTHVGIRIAVAAALAFAVLIIAAVPAAWQICQTANTDVTRPLVPGGYGICIEFWLYRYQTLLGTFAAIGAAVVAWIAARQSVARLDRSIEVSRQQFAVASMEHLDRRRKTLSELRDAVDVSEGVARDGIYDAIKEHAERVAGMESLSAADRSSAASEFASMTARIAVKAPMLQAAAENLLDIYKDKMLSKDCRLAISEQYWKINAIEGCGMVITEQLKIAEIETARSGRIADGTTEELIEWSAAASDHLRSRIFANALELIDREIGQVNRIADKIFTLIEKF